MIKFKNPRLKSSLCSHGDAYIHVKGTITIPKSETAVTPNDRNKKVIFKNCAPFTDCISKINNARVNNAKNIDVVLPIYNLIKYSDNYFKTSGSVWQYQRDKSTLNNNGHITDFLENNNNSISFKFKDKITRQTNNNRTKNVEIMYR